MASPASDGAPDVHGAYYTGFVAVLYGCFSPFKVLAYALPALFLVWLLARRGSGVSQTKLLGVICAWVIVGFTYNLVVEEFLVSNYVLALVTYSAFIPVLVIDGRHLASPALLRRLLVTVSAMLGFQGLLGIVQAFYGMVESGAFEGSNGDYVEGTIHPQLSAEYAFANPMFAANVALMLLACMSIPDVLTGQRRKYALLATVALVLASVVHILVFLIGALGLGFLVVRIAKTPPAHEIARRKGRRTLLLTLLLAGGISILAIPQNLSRVTETAFRIVDVDRIDIPRTVMLYAVITQLPEAAPLQPWIGLGPGQFSSRASLLASGFYLGGPESPRALPMMEPQATRLTDEFCLGILRAFAEDYRSFGAANQPFFSFLSIYTETGGVGLLLVVWLFIKMLRRVRQRVRADASLRQMAFFFSAGSALIAFLGLIENYWEVPQALFVGLLLLKVMHANIMYGERATNQE